MKKVEIELRAQCCAHYPHWIGMSLVCSKCGKLLELPPMPVGRTTFEAKTKNFLQDETGTVSVELVIWFTFLFGLFMVFAHQVVVPIMELAVEQSKLNQESLGIIEEAMKLCPPVTP